MLELAKVAKSSGRKVLLVSASPSIWVEGIGKHVGLFSDTMSTKATNLAGSNKARALVSAFGRKGYDYAGNSTADLAVWSESRTGIVVSDKKSLVRKARQLPPRLPMLFLHPMHPFSLTSRPYGFING